MTGGIKAATSLIQPVSDTVSYAIDSNDESRLLTDADIENDIAVVGKQRLIPSTAAMSSLFSENKLLLDQD